LSAGRSNALSDPDSLPAAGRTLRPAGNGVVSALPTDDAGAPYDRKAAVYDRVVGARAYNRVVWGTSTAAYREFASEALASGSGPMLDAGCGSALFTAGVYRRASRPLVLVDRSVGMLVRASGRLQGVPAGFVQADLSDLPFAPGCFTTVGGFGTLPSSTTRALRSPHYGGRWRPGANSSRRCSSPTAPSAALTCESCNARARWGAKESRRTRSRCTPSGRGLARGRSDGLDGMTPSEESGGLRARRVGPDRRTATRDSPRLDDAECSRWKPSQRRRCHAGGIGAPSPVGHRTAQSADRSAGAIEDDDMPIETTSGADAKGAVEALGAQDCVGPLVHRADRGRLGGAPRWCCSSSPRCHKRFSAGVFMPKPRAEEETWPATPGYRRPN
jgi:hypothetical protein